MAGMRILLAFLACLALAACGPRDNRSDLEKLTAFHRQMIALDRQVHTASAAYTRDSGAALDRHDNAALVAAAQHFAGTLSALLPRAQALDVPRFDNGDAERAAGRAAAALVAAVRARRDAANAVRAMADPHDPAPNEIAAVAAARDTSNSADVAETSSIIAAYGALGIRPNHVDMQAGGVKR
jgi:hypothetical protein